MILGFGNNTVSSLASDITASQTTFSVIPGDGPAFAALLTSDFSNKSTTLKKYAKITLTDSGETAFEICHLTAVSGDTLTVIRGQEGTAAKGWSLKDVVANFATRGSENTFAQIAHIQSGFYTSGTAGGTANALTLELPSTFALNGSTDWFLKTPIVVYPSQNNTAAATLQLTMGGRVLGTFPLYKGNKAQLTANDILKDVGLVCLMDNTKTFFSVANPGAIYAGLGTAAFKDLTTSRTDTVAGHVLQVGDYGLGVANGSVLLLNSIYDIKCSGEYNALGDGTSTPTTGIPAGVGNTRFAVSAGNIFSNQYLVTLTSNVHFYVGVVDTAKKTSTWSKFYNTSNKPSADDVGAIPTAIVGSISNNGSMANAKINGWWQVSVSDPKTVPGFPKHPDGTYLYGYGYMFNWVIGNTWFQLYYAHHGENATRQNWSAGPDTATAWVIGYNTVSKPTAGDVGAYTKGECDTKFQPKGNYTPTGTAYTKSESDARYNRKNTASLAGNGWFKDTSSGFIHQWGGVGSVNNGSVIKYPIAFPTGIGVVLPVSHNSSLDVGTSSVTKTQFTLNMSGGPGDIYWSADGWGAAASAKKLKSALLSAQPESEYYYSSANNAFYPSDLYVDYVAAGTWPDDAVAVETAIFLEFAANDAPVGKYRVAGDDGLPAWADILPPTHSELVMQAESMKVELMEVAEAKIKLLERVDKLDMATDEEKSLLEEWEKYSVLLMRIDPEQAPDIVWPSKPS